MPAPALLSDPPMVSATGTFDVRCLMVDLIEPNVRCLNCRATASVADRLGKRQAMRLPYT
jgi:hypothetical protein